MYTTEGITAQAHFDDAAARLADVVRGMALQRASRAAYNDELSAAGAAPGWPAWSWQLARVQVSSPFREGATIKVPVLWQVTGACDDDGLCVVLAAELELSELTGGRVLLRLTGVFRPPVRLVLTEVQTARFARNAMRSLLRRAADAVSDPPLSASGPHALGGGDGSPVRCLVPSMKCMPIWAWLSPRCAPCRGSASQAPQ